MYSKPCRKETHNQRANALTNIQKCYESITVKYSSISYITEVIYQQ